MVVELAKNVFIAALDLMPSKTPKQRRAMAAGCKGKSKLGIPRKVACDYHRADKRKARRK